MKQQFNFTLQQHQQEQISILFFPSMNLVWTILELYSYIIAMALSFENFVACLIYYVYVCAYICGMYL